MEEPLTSYPLTDLQKLRLQRNIEREELRTLKQFEREKNDYKLLEEYTSKDVEFIHFTKNHANNFSVIGASSGCIVISFIFIINVFVIICSIIQFSVINNLVTRFKDDKLQSLLITLDDLEDGNNCLVLLSSLLSLCLFVVIIIAYTQSYFQLFCKVRSIVLMREVIDDDSGLEHTHLDTNDFIRNKHGLLVNTEIHTT